MEYPINLVETQLFDLNARIQQLTWSLFFYEKYSTSLSTIVLVVLTTANFGGFSNFCRYYTRSQMGKSTGYWPTLKPLHCDIVNLFSSVIWHEDVNLVGVILTITNMTLNWQALPTILKIVHYFTWSDTHVYIKMIFGW